MNRAGLPSDHCGSGPGVLVARGHGNGAMMQSNSVFRFSTDTVPVKDRVAIWREVIGRQYMRLDVEPDQSVALQAELEVHTLPSTVVALFRSTPMTYTRTQLEARSGDSDFTFVAASRDRFRFHADGNEQIFFAGGAVLLFNGRSGSIDAPHDGRMLTIRVNGSMLRAAARELDERSVYPLRADSTPLRLLDRYIDSVLQSGPLDPALDHLVNVHITDLLALSLRPTEETLARAEAGAVQAARLAAIRADVLANFSQVRLSAKTIAKRHGVSERYVYLLFEQNGLSFSRLVTEERLKRAMIMLLDPACSAMRISDIALAVGFGDLTTFNRAFRLRYGDTPRDMRRGRAPGDESA
jgi:AraC-like DNA-binding protein